MCSIIPGRKTMMILIKKAMEDNKDKKKRPRIKTMRAERVLRCTPQREITVFPAIKKRLVDLEILGTKIAIIFVFLASMFGLQSCGTAPAARPLQDASVEQMYLAACKGGGLERVAITDSNLVRLREKFIGGCPAYYVKTKGGHTYLIDFDTYSLLVARHECNRKFSVCLKDFEGIWVADSTTLKDEF